MKLSDMTANYLQKSVQTWLVLCLAVIFCFTAIDAVWAQGIPPAPAPDGTCTTDPQFNPAPPSADDGILTRITNNVRSVLDGVASTMYNYVIDDSGFREMVGAVVTLYIAIYGILFTFAMVQATLFDFASRLIKLGIIATLISGGSWAFFNDTVVTFFNDGTDNLIARLTQITVGGISQPINPGDSPFVVIDGVIHQALSAKFAVTLLASFFTGPYGALFGILILMSLSIFVRALLVAVWVYLMSLVIKTLLFGMAPLFIVALLFNRTRHLFQGWLNQVINASLQPILLFAFFAFFARLISAAIDNILQVPVCWTETMESVRGTPFNMHYWRFTHEDEPFGGIWTWTGADTPSSPIFPIDLMDVLIFLILAELASRFNSVVLMIARDLANATTSLASMQGGLANFMKGGPTGRKGGPPGGDGAGGGMPGRAGGNRGDGSRSTPGAGIDSAADRADQLGAGAGNAVASASGQAFPPGGNRLA